MVPCWVDVDQKTGRVQDFSDLGKYPRYLGFYQSFISTVDQCINLIDTGLAVLDTFPSQKNLEQDRSEVKVDP